MSFFNHYGPLTLPAAGPIKRFRRVVRNAQGQLTLAGVADREHGEIIHEAFAAGDLRAFVPRNVPGVHRLVANGVIAAGATVYTAADGKVSATSGEGSHVEGTAWTAASADGDVISVLMQPR